MPGLSGPGSGQFDGRIAQLVEQLTLNQRVQGSSPCAPTIEIKGLGRYCAPRRIFWTSLRRPIAQPGEVASYDLSRAPVKRRRTCGRGLACNNRSDKGPRKGPRFVAKAVRDWIAAGDARKSAHGRHSATTRADTQSARHNGRKPNRS